MDIKEIVFYVTETKTYEVVVSLETGYEMPTKAKEFVDFVNDAHGNPTLFLSMERLKSTNQSVEITDYVIKEGK